MYCTHVCGYCVAASKLFGKKGVPIETIYVDDEPARRAEMVEITGRTTVPQIFIGSRYVGGYRELAQLEIGNQLDTLLQDR